MTGAASLLTGVASLVAVATRSLVLGQEMPALTGKLETSSESS